MPPGIATTGPVGGPDTFAKRLASSPGGDHLGSVVFADVLARERRPSRIRPLLAAWTDRFVAAVRRGDHVAANRWMRVLTDAAPWDDASRPLVDATLDEVTTVELVENLVVDLSHDDRDGAGSALVGAWGRRLVPWFLEWIVVDDPPVSRKHIVDCLAAVARADVDTVAAHLGDSRWFVVRNFATAVGRSGDPRGVEPLIGALAHSDDRVRVEALRGLAALDREGSVTTVVDAIEDQSERVRQAAISLLRAIPDDGIVALVEELIADKRVGAVDARRLVGVIAERPDPISRPALQRLAARRPAFGVHKAARVAAGIELSSRPL